MKFSFIYFIHPHDYAVKHYEVVIIETEVQNVFFQYKMINKLVLEVKFSEIQWYIYHTSDINTTLKLGIYPYKGGKNYLSRPLPIWGVCDYFYYNV